MPFKTLSLLKQLPSLIRTHGWLYGFAIQNIPMILYLTPKIESLNKERSHIIIPLNYRSKNHLGSLYFGALCVGADLCAGLIALQHMTTAQQHHKTRFDFVFKDVQAQFLRRADHHTHFICDHGERIGQCLQAALKGGEREECGVSVQAYSEEDLTTVVARFQLTLSLKKRQP